MIAWSTPTTYLHAYCKSSKLLSTTPSAPTKINKIVTSPPLGIASLSTGRRHIFSPKAENCLRGNSSPPDPNYTCPHSCLHSCPQRQSLQEHKVVGAEVWRSLPPFVLSPTMVMLRISEAPSIDCVLLTPHGSIALRAQLLVWGLPCCESPTRPLLIPQGLLLHSHHYPAIDFHASERRNSVNPTRSCQARSATVATCGDIGDTTT